MYNQVFYFYQMMNFWGIFYFTIYFMMLFAWIVLSSYLYLHVNRYAWTIGVVLLSMLLGITVFKSLELWVGLLLATCVFAHLIGSYFHQLTSKTTDL